VNDAGRRRQQPGHVEIRAECEHEEQRCGEGGQVALRRTRNSPSAGQVEIDRAGKHIHRTGDDSRQRDEREQITAKRLEEGELKYKEADVPAEQGVHLAERLPMTEQQPSLPLG
jgi:hypothetical protein